MAIACAPVDLKAFRFRAVVDWIEVRVTLAGPSQPQHVRARMPAHWGLPYTTAEAADSSRTAQSFTFRVQDPAGPVQFMLDVQNIVRPGDPPLTCKDVEIVAVEVALDARHRSHDKAALVAMAERMLWAQSVWASFARITSDTRKVSVTTASGPRTAKLRDGYEGIATAPKAHRALARGWTINLGARSADFRQRIYVKCHDSRGGESYQSLPAEEHRARFEVTLSGARRPFTTIDEWQTFRFEELSHKLFSWRQRLGVEWGPAYGADGWPELIPRLGLMANSQARARKSNRKSTRLGTGPDRTLNRRAYEALCRLSDAQCTAGAHLDV